jgi:hypothetical protein
MIPSEIAERARQIEARIASHPATNRDLAEAHGLLRAYRDYLDGLLTRDLLVPPGTDPWKRVREVIDGKQ